MANRKRKIQLKIWVDEEEKLLIQEKMKQLGTSQIGAYLRKMAIDGYVINFDTTDIKTFSKELQK
ncbi:MAG: plasmid mobilization relaxosome protein MobC, partial [Clostridia bacterium]|nr:plasmid mobilization relaxosome protein MobC [Clostridia bacterium]